MKYPLSIEDQHNDNRLGISLHGPREENEEKGRLIKKSRAEPLKYVFQKDPYRDGQRSVKRHGKRGEGGGKKSIEWG